MFILILLWLKIEILLYLVLLFCLESIFEPIAHFLKIFILHYVWKYAYHVLFSTYTYIIGHYNPSIRIIDLVSHTTYVVCINFIHKWRDLQFKVNSERKSSWETFHGSFNLLSEFLPEICWEKFAEEILFVFWFDVWLGARTLAFRLISQHTTY